jgi:transposase-like protein
VYVVLTANDGNVKRTARETGVPENTVRRWRNDFQKNGPPKTDEVEQAASDFVEDADRVRTKALALIEQKIDAGDAKVNELNNTVGILTDKIDRAKGLDSRRVDHHHHLPAADEVRELMEGFVNNARALSVAREAEIVEAEIVEQPALPQGS